jgi:putative redox protein
MKATARRVRGTVLTQRIEVGRHELLADEPAELDGDDEGPTAQELLAASLASCTAITIEMYARRKGWDLGQAEVRCEYEPPEPGQPTEFALVLRLPGGLSSEQVQRIRAIAAKCPVHRILAGEVSFTDRVEFADASGT